MKRFFMITGLTALLASPLLADDAAVMFERARKSAAARDFALSLDQFEGALLGDANNLRYGAEYRQAVIAAGAYDRCIAFFEKLTTDSPQAANAFLNLGYAFVDKIPVEGAITQVLLANTALTHFSKAIEVEDSWLARYTRGNSYLFWPAIFGRTPLAIADLERANELAKGLEKKPYHARSWAGLGDGYWRLEDVAKAREIWQQGQALFPDDPDLKARLERQGDELNAYLEAHFDTTQRVATHLHEIFGTE
ncbi:MAG: hypothetical protein HC897_10465 [Thermoanaerobaculia bacterium]|nr:hypothetical protein [Thermoanaerobaculia bacterium]